jgi:pantoate kinase
MPSSDDGRTIRTAAAFAPGHLTCWFVPRESVPDPRGRGSVGGGIALALGVHARVTYRPDGPTRTRFVTSPPRSVPISREVVRRLRRGRRGEIRVELVHELPIGQGFGMSAAGALATALAAARVLGDPRRRAIEVAHLADLFGRGGLGGVAAILEGGLEWRRRAGVPPWGEVRHRRWTGTIELIVIGPPIDSPSVLSDPRFLDRVRRAGRSAERRLDGRFNATSLFATAERFTDEVRLGPGSLRDTLAALRGPGVRVGQAMFGNCLYAIPSTRGAAARLRGRVEALCLRAIRTRGSARGARFERASTSRRRATLLKGGRSRTAP